LWGHIRDVRDKLGTTVFVTTHYMDEADSLCDRIIIIDHGSVVAEGSPHELKQRLGGDALRLGLEPGANLEAAVDTIRRHTTAAPEVDGHDVRLRLTGGGAQLPGLLLALAQASVAVASVELRTPTLDDVFLTLTGRSLREEAT
jgi:ABC-2 type transport system ATP-binding protein